MGTTTCPSSRCPAGQSREEVLEQPSPGRACASGWAWSRTSRSSPQYAPYVERMKHELGVIKSMGFAGYFLIVADFINYAKRNEIPVGPGRGSVGG